MKLLLVADGRTASGGTPLLMHNERLSDPLDQLRKELAEATDKPSKDRTDADHLEISRREFFGGLYTDPIITTLSALDGQRPALPAGNLLACLRAGAKKTKGGTKVQQGVVALSPYATLTYDGPDDIRERWQQQLLVRKGVKLSGRKVIRTRPLFLNWQAELEVEFDADVLNAKAIASYWEMAGRLIGLGDYRPLFGKFAGKTKGVK